MARDIENAITQKGLWLISRTLAEGKPIVFEKAVIGTGLVGDTDNLRMRTSLLTYIADASIISKTVDENGNLIVTVSYWNDAVDDVVTIEEIGLLAKIQGDENSVLFSYLTFGQYPDTVFPADAATIQRTYDLPYAFGSGDMTSVTIVPSGLLSASDAVDTAEAGKLLRLDADGKLPADITGDAITLGGHGVAYFATADHRHDNATSTKDGFLSMTDKATLDRLDDYVDQGVTTESSPTFAGLTVNGYIFGAQFL